jgi:PAS domain S-box-containing protein
MTNQTEELAILKNSLQLEIEKRKFAEKQLETIVENTYEAFLIVDKDLIVIGFNATFNKQYQLFFGKSIVKGESVLKFVLPGREDFVANIYSAVFKGQIIEREMPVDGHEQGILTFKNLYKPLYDEHKNVVAAFVSSIDITDNKNKETEILSREKRFRSLIENNFDVISLYDKDWKVVYLSPSFVRLTGYSKSERLNNPGFNFLHPDDQEKTKEILQEVIANPAKPINFQNRFLHKNGNYIWIEGVLINLLADKNVNAIVANYRDITERKNAETDMQRLLNELSHQKYAIDQHSIVAVTDVKGTILYVNDKFCTISQYSKEELLGKNHRIINSGFHPKDFFTEMFKTISNGKVWNGEICNRSKDGNLYWVDTTIAPFIDENTGKVTQYIAIRTDITQRKKDVNTLIVLNEQLSKRADELLLINSELEQFAYIASHDLQEPLRMVTNFLSLIELRYKDKLDDAGKQYIDFAVDGAKRMRRIILDLLEYSMIGKKEYEFASLDMNQLMQEIAEVNHSSLQEKNASVQFENLPTIKGNKTALMQVLQNLIGNALKYHSNENPPHIMVSAKEEFDAWQFSISDNGIGIDSQFFDKIFIVFQRLHNKDDYSGTGIGLAICKKIIEGHKGKIWVTSEIGKGSTFYFTINK